MKKENGNMNDTCGAWFIHKEGQVPGYRSSLSFIPHFKIGIFNSVLQSDTTDDPTNSVIKLIF